VEAGVPSCAWYGEISTGQGMSVSTHVHFNSHVPYLKRKILYCGYPYQVFEPCCLIHKSTSVKKQTFAIVNRIFKAISSRDMSQSLIDVLLRPHTLWQGSVVTLRMQMHICLTFSIFREGGLVNCSLCSRRYCQSWTISSEWESVFTVTLSPNLPHSRNWGCIC
jgi:hypothetical protein